MNEPTPDLEERIAAAVLAYLERQPGARVTALGVREGRATRPSACAALGVRGPRRARPSACAALGVRDWWLPKVLRSAPVADVEVVLRALAESGRLRALPTRGATQFARAGPPAGKTGPLDDHG